MPNNNTEFDYTKLHRWVDGIPEYLTESEALVFEARKAKMLANQVRNDALAEISRLESEVTERRKREAILTEEGKQWLVLQDDLISAQRTIVQNNPLIT